MNGYCSGGKGAGGGKHSVAQACAQIPLNAPGATADPASMAAAKNEQLLAPQCLQWQPNTSSLVKCIWQQPCNSCTHQSASCCAGGSGGRPPPTDPPQPRPHPFRPPAGEATSVVQRVQRANVKECIATALLPLHQPRSDPANPCASTEAAANQQATGRRALGAPPFPAAPLQTCACGQRPLAAWGWPPAEPRAWLPAPQQRPAPRRH